MMSCDSTTTPPICRLTWRHNNERIRNFLELSEGWHFGEGTKILPRAVGEAEYLNSLLGLNGFGETDAFPGLDGEIRITSYCTEDYFEFTRESDDSWTFLHERQGTEIERRSSLSLIDVFFIVSLLGKKVCTSSASYRHLGTGTVGSSGFRVWLSGRAPMEESQCLTETARCEPRKQFASTFQGSTRRFRMSPQYFGNLTPA